MTSTRRGRGVRLRHADGGRGVSSMWTSTQKISKLEPTDIILSSSHTKKLTFVDQNFVFGQSKKGKFFININ